MLHNGVTYGSPLDGEKKETVSGNAVVYVVCVADADCDDVIYDASDVCRVLGGEDDPGRGAKIS